MQDFDRAWGLLEQRQDLVGRLLRIFFFAAFLANKSGHVADDPDLPILLVNEVCQLFDEFAAAEIAMVHGCLIYPFDAQRGQ